MSLLPGQYPGANQIKSLIEGMSGGLGWTRAGMLHEYLYYV
jgi:hypothetical protein